MERKKFYIIFSIVAFLFIVQHIFIKQPDILRNVKASDDFSNIEIKLLDGGFEPLGFYAGKKPVVLIFWRSDVDPCKYILEEVNAKIDEWRSKYDFELIAVNVSESQDVIESAKDAWNLKMKIGLDPKGKIAGQFGVAAVPTVIILRKDGTLRKKYDRYEPEMEEAIERRIRPESEEDTITKIRIHNGDTTITRESE